MGGRVTAWLAAVWLACSGLRADEGPPVEVPAPPDPIPSAGEDAAPLAEPNEPRYAATHVLISWAGAPRSAATRTEAEAEAIARTVHEEALQGSDLESLARTYSDGPSAARGGKLGVYSTGTMVPDFERAVASVEVGAIAPLVRSPFGWHVARRDAVMEARAAHILVSWDGAWRSKQTRSRADARTRIEEAGRALASGRSFADVAAQFSDGPSASRGGDLGRVAPGQFLPPFEAALFALSPGAVSEVVETEYGFHLILRQD